MEIVLVVAASAPPFRWQADVARRLALVGHDVRWEAVAGTPAWPVAVHLLLDIERLVYRRRAGPRPSDRIPLPGPVARPPGPGFVLDLSGRESGGSADLRLLYDGCPDPAAAVAALIDRRPVRLDVVRTDRTIATGRPGNEEPALISAGLDALFARAADLCCAAVAWIVSAGTGAEGTELELPSTFAGRSLGPAGARAVGFSVRSLAGKVGGLLKRRLTHPETWHVGLRRRGMRGILDEGHIAAEGFVWLRPDGSHYYADPFLITREGRTWLFVEDYLYRDGKGVISVCEVAPDGRPGPTRVVLEEPFHLSYPLVFSEGGTVWMIPETHAAGEVVLYRATDFPWRWERERVLIAGAALSDATPVRHDGRLWIFATEIGLPGGSSSDALSLFHAPDLFGDVAPHPLNPVLVDARAARPGGRMLHRGGRLLRVAQDCRTGYGRAAVLATVDRLDLGGYRQTLVADLRAPSDWGASGLHTIETGEDFEAIDILAPTPPPDA